MTRGGLLVAEPAAMAAAQRSVGKTDALDAVRIARSVLAVDSSRLRSPRADGQRVALRVLSVAREQMVAERTRTINALTALLRTVALGIHVRKALAHSQFKVIAGWRERKEDPVTATCRQEAIRLAKRIVALDSELADNRKALDSIVAQVAPELCELPGVGSVVAAAVMTAWSHPGGFAPKQRSPRWRVLAPYQRHQATPSGTDSITEVNGGSTER